MILLLLMVAMLGVLLLPVWLRLPRPRWISGSVAAWLVLLGASQAGAPLEPHLASALLMSGVCAVMARFLEAPPRA